MAFARSTNSLGEGTEGNPMLGKIASQSFDASAAATTVRRRLAIIALRLPSWQNGGVDSSADPLG